MKPFAQFGAVVNYYDSCKMLSLNKMAFYLEIQVFACYCMTSVFKTSLCNQFSIIVGHLVYQHRSLRIYAADT